MEPFIFAGNRRRWKYVRPVVVAATFGAGIWLAALGWVLLTAPSLPAVDLGATRATVLARAGLPLTQGRAHGPRWTLR